jgi:pimeloyl-ACP methyl ester carboxylesterase
VDGWLAQPLFASQTARLDGSQRTRARSQRLRNRPEALAAALRGLGTGSMPSLWDRLGEVSAPVLLVAGEEDGKFAGLARSMAERLRRAEVAIVPEAGHAVQAEAPAALAARWEAFRAAVDGEVE